MAMGDEYQVISNDPVQKGEGSLQLALGRLEMVSSAQKPVVKTSFIIVGALLFVSIFSYCSEIYIHMSNSSAISGKWDIAIMTVEISAMLVAFIIIVLRARWIYRCGANQVRSKLEKSGLAKRIAMGDLNLAGLYRSLWLGFDFGWGSIS